MDMMADESCCQWLPTNSIGPGLNFMGSCVSFHDMDEPNQHLHGTRMGTTSISYPGELHALTRAKH